MEGDRVRAGSRPRSPARGRTASSRSARQPPARRRCRRSRRPPGLEDERTLDRPAEVLRPDERPGRVADARTQLEAVRAGRRRSEREARRRGRAPGGAPALPPTRLEAHEPVVRERQQLRRSRHSRAGSIPARSPPFEHRQRAAAVAGARGSHRDEELAPSPRRPPRGGCRSSPSATTVLRHRVDPRERSGELVAHPDGRAGRPRSRSGPSPTAIVAAHLVR